MLSLSPEAGDLHGQGPVRLLIATVAGQHVAMRLEEIAEILPLPLLMPLPEAPPVVRGAFRLGAAIRLVLDLRCLLALAPPLADIPADHHLLLPRDMADDAVFLVDRVETIAAGILGPCPEAGLNGCVVGQAAVGEEILPLLALDRVLGAAEGERIAALARRSAERATLFGLAAEA